MNNVQKINLFFKCFNFFFFHINTQSMVKYEYALPKHEFKGSSLAEHLNRNISFISIDMSTISSFIYWLIEYFILKFTNKLSFQHSNNLNHSLMLY